MARYATLHISATAIKLLVVKGRRVESWNSKPLPAGLVKDGLILQPKLVGTVVASLFKEEKITDEPVIVSFTGMPFTYRFINLPVMNKAAQREAIERAAKREMQMPIDELYLSWQLFPGGRNEEVAFITGVPRKVVDAARQMLAEAGSKINILDLKPLALARAAHAYNAIILDFEPERFDIIVVADGRIAIMHSIVPKRGESVAEYDIQQLADEVSRTIEYYNDNHPHSHLSPATTPVVIAGDSIPNASIDEVVHETTGYQITPLSLPYRLPDDLTANRFATNIGLALKKIPLKLISPIKDAHYQDININLVADTSRNPLTRIKASGIWALLIVMVGTGLIFPLYQLRNRVSIEVSQLDSELGTLQQQVNVRLQSVNEAAHVEQTIDAILNRSEALKNRYQTVLGMRSEYARELELASTSLPSGAALTSLEMNRSQIIIVGTANEVFSVIEYVTRLEGSGQFTDLRITWIGDDSKKIDTQNSVVGVSFRLLAKK